MIIPPSLLNQLHNQFVGGGLLLMLSGSVLALARKVPGEICGWFKRRLTSEVEILNSDPLFDYVAYWLDQQPYSKRSRKLTATTATLLDHADDDDETPQPAAQIEAKRIRVFFTPAPGIHYFFHGMRLLKLQRERDKEAPKGGGQKEIFSLRKSETFTITIFGRSQAPIRELIEEIAQLAARPSGNIKLYYCGFGYWQSFGVISPRKLSSVVLPAGVAEEVLGTLKDFLNKSEWYRSVGIPWHMGCLFHGLPGTGKSSLVAALAGELHMNLYLLNIGGSGMDDERLSSLMADIRPGSMVLMEDVDCTIPERSSKESKGITLSGMLNCMDGVGSREGCIIFMTTNRRAVLDDALTRPGRIDMEIEFREATEDQILRLRDRLAPGIEDGAVIGRCMGMTMAQVQQELLRPGSVHMAGTSFQAEGKTTCANTL